jgi:hypothetical protein
MVSHVVGVVVVTAVIDKIAYRRFDYSSILAGEWIHVMMDA